MWERKITRKIKRPTYENGYWRIKMNKKMNKIQSAAGIGTVL